MNGPRLLCGLLLCWGLQAAAQTDAVTQGSAPIERQRLAAERARAEADFSREEQACQSRFAVQSCVDQVAARRRTLERELKRQEAALNAVERQQRAQEQLQRSAEKARDHQERSSEPTGDTAADRARALHEKQQAHRQQASAMPSGAGSKPLPEAPGAAELASQREAYAAKQRAAQERRAARDRRLRESKEKSRVLPTPP